VGGGETRVVVPKGFRTGACPIPIGLSGVVVVVEPWWHPHNHGSIVASETMREILRIFRHLARLVRRLCSIGA
jgi:hypothetical protein